jgi:hypothetical protein
VDFGDQGAGGGFTGYVLGETHRTTPTITQAVPTT